MQLPAAAPIFQFIKPRTSLCSRVSNNSACLGQHQGGLPISILWGRGRKVMHLPCKQAETGALPVGLHHFTAGNSTKVQRTVS